MNDTKVLIIAEIGTSHGGSLDKAKRLADVAAEAGADCIKFQWVYADEILHPNTGYVNLPGGKIRLYDRFKELEMPPSFFETMRNYVRSLGKSFMCSPFGIRSAEELFALQPDYIKVASPELNHFPMLKKLCALETSLSEKKQIPLVLSSGVSKMEDIKKAFEVFKPLKKLSLLHCITSYPAPPEEYNLSLISLYAKKFGIDTGVSDHSLDPRIVPVMAAVCGARLIEKHITLSRTTGGLDDPVALPPDLFSDMVQSVRRYEKMPPEKALEEAQTEFGEELCQKVIGNGVKELAPSEKANYGRTNRSIHFMHDMKKGDVIREKDIGVLRTEKELSVGISPEYYERVIGLKISKNVKAGEGLQWIHTERGVSPL
ncbi:N-acetylneuraminate synthase family protein [Treponema sp. OMZ 840]|uniref:N-acetylneuraminate synthase family protein n=1 Tax=Treponema sp. OMZ 840 TaxID=244313 RepID=UPI003D943D5D